MRQTMKKPIALLLVLVQLFVLCPVLQPQAKAAEPESPVLNETIIGTVQFGSFNYLSGSNGKEAADYVMPFVYTDDYFAASAIQPNVTGKEMNWDKLEDKSLATASMNFTMACFGSNEEITNVADYESDYDKNGVQYLQKCRFENIETNNYEYDGSNPLTKENKYNKFPSKDSVGVIIGSKQIKVYNPDTQKNETYTLVAVGVRGAGYGAEWASNVTLGTGTQSKEHQGFRDGADKVEYKLDDYLNQHGITASQNVKFWVCGYSRAGAIANLVAGDLSAKSKYNVAKENVYGYTYESAAGADKTVDPNGTVYPNIHNIMNKMDVVPRVSADFFGNNRYGVDYIVPNYANASANNLNANYYNRMYKILQTIATGYFDKDGNAQEDPAVTNAKPGTYPVDGTIQVHQFEIKSATNGSFGAVPYTGRWGNQPSGTDIGTKSGSNYYIKLDTYLDKLVNMMFGSKAWDYNPRNASATITNTNHMTHRQKFATKQNGQSESYQDAMRDLVGIALGTPGAKLSDMFDDIAGTLFSNLLDAAQLLLSITGNRLGWFSNGYDDHPDDEHAETVSGHMKDLLYGVLKDKYPFSENRTTTQTAINTLSPVLTRLFLYDRSNYGSQYLGTLLKYALGTILVTHTPGLDVSWQMAMDDNYTSDYRELTFPIDADVKIFRFRDGVDGTFTATGILDTTSPTVYDNGDAAGALVAEVKNAAFVPVKDPLGNDRDTLDQRISVKTDSSGTLQVVRYPADLNLRFDAKNASTQDVETASALAFRPQDATATSMKATYTRLDNGNINQDSVRLEQLVGSYDSTVASALTNKTANSNVMMNAGDTLRVFTYAATNRLEQNASKSGGFDVFLDRKPTTTVVDYASTDGITDGTESNPLLLGTVNQQETTKTVQNGLRVRSTVSTVPASSIYYDDDFADTALTGNPGDTIFSSVAATLDVDGTTQYWYQFSGSRIDVYCTTYNQEGTGETAVKPGYVQAKIVGADKETVLQTAAIRNQSDDVRYNVPTISFDGLTPGETYYLVLNVLGSSNYKLDGIRVYNAIADQSVYDGSTEQYAAFINLRDALVNNESAYNAFTHDVMTGALFVDDTDRLNTQQQAIDAQTGEPIVDENNQPVMMEAYESTFEAYQKNSPKSEIYLAKNQAITFKLTETALQEGTNLWVGLSAPDAGKNTGTVTISGVEQPVNSAVDTYYEITSAMIGANGTVTIKNTTDNLIAVTNLKITGNETIYNAANASEAKSLSAEDGAVVLSLADVIPMVFEPVTVESIQSAAAVSDPTPTPDLSALIQQLISTFVQSLFSSISRLFGN